MKARRRKHQRRGTQSPSVSIFLTRLRYGDDDDSSLLTYRLIFTRTVSFASPDAHGRDNVTDVIGLRAVGVSDWRSVCFAAAYTRMQAPSNATLRILFHRTSFMALRIFL